MSFEDTTLTITGDHRAPTFDVGCGEGDGSRPVREVS